MLGGKLYDKINRSEYVLRNRQSSEIRQSMPITQKSRCPHGTECRTAQADDENSRTEKYERSQRLERLSANSY